MTAKRPKGSPAGSPTDVGRTEDGFAERAGFSLSASNKVTTPSCLGSPDQETWPGEHRHFGSLLTAS